jgi:RNA polymerase sigma-70 factor (ECF subfamily)
MCERRVVILVPANGASLATPEPLLETTPGRAVADAHLSDAPAGDLPAAPPPFEQVYREHAARVYRYCLSQVGNACDAEDLAADVFAAAFAAYLGARLDGGVVLPWLLRIARNEVIDHRRRRTRRSALLARFFGGQPEIDRTVDVEGVVVLRDELSRALAVMRALSERDRMLIGLRLAADLPYGEIGEVVGLSEHAATVATRRALQRLRKRLGAPS